MIREAVSKVKAAVATKDVIPYMTHFWIHGGMIHATNGRIIAAAPFPDDRSYLVPAQMFEKTLDRMPSDDIKIELDDHHDVKITCGRYRGKLKTLQQTVTLPGPEGVSAECPPSFYERLKAIRPFVSDNATQPFALCIMMDGEHMFATNNVCLAAAFEVGLPEMYSMLPCWSADFILGRDTPPIRIQWDEKSMSFHWSDGSWMKTQLMAAKFPESAKAMVYNAPQPEWEIPGDWRDVFRDVCALAAEAIHIYPHKVTGGHNHGDLSAEAETPIPAGVEYTVWNPKFLLPVIENATHFDPTYWPKPCPFTGPLVAGVIMGIRR